MKPMQTRLRRFGLCANGAYGLLAARYLLRKYAGGTFITAKHRKPA